MPQSFQGNELAFAIAAIEDDAYPFTENRLPDAEIAVRPRSPYSRHTLLGINQYGLEMFAQFPLLLGLRTVDPMVPDTTQLGLITAIDAGNELAKRRTARIEIRDLVTGGPQPITAEVQVTNLTGHKFPSGVGFRRAFLEFELLDGDGRRLWASGASNHLGVILDGDDRPLKTEFFGPDQQDWQPHHRTISRQDQVQIYEILDRNAKGELTTSFLGLYQSVKDNRLLPTGWRRDGPFAEYTAPCLFDPASADKDKCRFLDEPGYNDGGGYDRLTYQVACSEALEATARVAVRLYYQAIPPYYLTQRFAQVQGPDTRRLHYLASHLRTEGTNIENWKLLIDEQVVDLPPGSVCGG